MGFFNLYKPREYKHKYIYYDPKKEAAKEREERMASEKKEGEEQGYKPGIGRGTFRQMAEKHGKMRSSETRQSNIRLIIIILILLAIAYYLLI